MEDLIRHLWILFIDVLENWAYLGIISILVSWLYRRISKNQQKQLKDIQMHIKRIELLQAINHDYGLQIVSGIFDEYTALGGNHYAHEIYERYKEGKENDFK